MNNKYKVENNFFYLNVSEKIHFDETIIHYTTKKGSVLNSDTLKCPISYISDSTLIISIGDICKTNLNLLITVSNKAYLAYAEFNSDYNQYYDKHSIKFKTDRSFLGLSKLDYEKGDTIYGKIKTDMFAIPDSIYFKHIDSICFNGDFVAIIEDCF